MSVPDLHPITQDQIFSWLAVIGSRNSKKWSPLGTVIDRQPERTPI